MNDLPAPPKAPGIAITSLVLGISSYLCLGPLTAIPAVICGHMAMGKIKRDPAIFGGQGMALTGTILGYVNIALSVLVIPLVLAISVPSFHAARESALRNACINNMRIIDSAKDQWAIENRRMDGDVPAERALYEYFIDGALPVCHAGGLYTIGPVGVPPKCGIPGHELPSYY